MVFHGHSQIILNQISVPPTCPGFRNTVPGSSCYPGVSINGMPFFPFLKEIMTYPKMNMKSELAH